VLRGGCIWAGCSGVCIPKTVCLSLFFGLSALPLVGLPLFGVSDGAPPCHLPPVHSRECRPL